MEVSTKAGGRRQGPEDTTRVIDDNDNDILTQKDTIFNNLKSIQRWVHMQRLLFYSGFATCKVFMNLQHLKNILNNEKCLYFLYTILCII